MTEPKRLNPFERYLTLWVALCMAAGVAIGRFLPGATELLRAMEFGDASRINVPIAVLLWLMIYPMMLKVDFASVVRVRERPNGLAVTLIVNWLVKPFSMALLGWIFFRHVFLPWIGPDLADQYTSGVIILAARRARRWSSSGRISPTATPRTLVQVAVNDLVVLVAFAPS